MLLEGGPRLLASYPPKLSHSAKDVLRKLGVDVRLETLVTEVAPDYVRAAGWTIPTHTVIWAAGNTASPLLQTLHAPLDRQGRVIVEPDCAVPGHPEVFVIGDAASFEHDEHGPLPGIAPVAIQMGQYVARTIESDLGGRPRTAFHYWDKGQLAVIGRGKAVADIWRLHFDGLFAWLTWIFVHILYLIGFRNRIMVLLQWAWSYITYGLGARLITEEYHPDGSHVGSGEGTGNRAGISGVRHHEPESDPRPTR
jgi:NADH dehydrogenase